jgi:hypothetical protein
MAGHSHALTANDLYCIQWIPIPKPKRFGLFESSGAMQISLATACKGPEILTLTQVEKFYVFIGGMNPVSFVSPPEGLLLTNFCAFLRPILFSTSSL